MGAPDPNAPIIHIRKDCTGLGNDCFDDADTDSDGLGDAVDTANAWTWQTRNPSASKPLVWDIGPGVFDGSINCGHPLGGTGHVTYRGAGRGQTVIEDRDPSGGLGTVDVMSCVNLDFQDLTIRSNQMAVYWKTNQGSSVWTNVDLVRIGQGAQAAGYANVWYEDACNGGTTFAEHYFFNTRMIMKGRNSANAVGGHAALQTDCSLLWFLGGEIQLLLDRKSQTGGSALNLGNFSGGRGDVRAFGTTIRTIRSVVNGGSSYLTAVKLGNNSVFHMHGGVIEARLQPGVTLPPGDTVSAYGIEAYGNAFAHAPGTAYVLEGDSVNRLYVEDDAKLLTPYVWPQGELPPTSGDETNLLGSLDGQDQFVETDCHASGECSDTQNPGNEPHLMLYNPAHCTAANPWLDSVTGRCRNDTMP